MCWHRPIQDWLYWQADQTVLFVQSLTAPPSFVPVWLCFSFLTDRTTPTQAESHARLQHFAQTHPSFIYLNRTRHDLSPNLTLLGCTLWSALDPDELDILSWSLQDLRRIDDLSPDAYNALHAGDLAWLNHTAAAMARDEPDRRIVVLTHHAPTQQGTSPPQFEGPGASVTKSAFSTELTGQPCWNPQVVKLWAFGHTHYSCDFERAGIRLYANQRGYKQGEGLYDPSGVVTV